jgi:hypothetical protein
MADNLAGQCWVWPRHSAGRRHRLVACGRFCRSSSLSKQVLCNPILAKPLSLDMEGALFPPRLPGLGSDPDPTRSTTLPRSPVLLNRPAQKTVARFIVRDWPLGVLFGRGVCRRRGCRANVYPASLRPAVRVDAAPFHLSKPGDLVPPKLFLAPQGESDSS